tara:strand:- start:2747 stop:2914 length:168 start_codon:yes stop_codon:yes gene_type:complete
MKTEEEIDKELKKQIEELKEFLKTVDIEDKESQGDLQHIDKQLDKLINKISKNEN